MVALEAIPHLYCRVGGKEGEGAVVFLVHNINGRIDFVSEVSKRESTIATLDEGVLGSKEVGCEGLMYEFGVFRV